MNQDSKPLVMHFFPPKKPSGFRHKYMGLLLLFVPSSFYVPGLVFIYAQDLQFLLKMLNLLEMLQDVSTTDFALLCFSQWQHEIFENQVAVSSKS